MKHPDKKFDNESQDARRHDKEQQVHPDEHRGEHKVKPGDKTSYGREKHKK